MRLFDRIAHDDYEQILFCHDRSSGLRAIIAIHSTRLGPALGGTRFHPYPDEEAALEDVLRLSRGMTYKSAAAGLDLGGGKAVIIGDPRRDRSEALLRSFGRHIGSLGGRYITAEDVGTTQADMDLLRRETRWVSGTSEAMGGSGDPSPATAWGLFHAITAALDHVGSSTVEGAHVVVGGVGKVGGATVEHLVGHGARVTVADVDADRTAALAERLGVDVVDPSEAHRVPCDVLSPNALGGGLNERTIPELRCRVVCGAANNQLAVEDEDAARLQEAGILYCPDFVVNAGGVINIAEELAPGGYHHDLAYARVARVGDNLRAVLDTARAKGITTERAADRVAERRIEAVSATRLFRPGDGA